MTRATWSQKYPETEPKLQGRDMSTCILAIGVFIVGIIFLAVALIIGLEFPKFVRNRAMDEQCIVNKQHDFFSNWRLEEDWVRYNKLYYWVIENPTEFLYHGQIPQLRERGPYVYREHREKTDVVFSGSRVTFRQVTRQSFDTLETATSCGQHCHEDDQLMMINKRFLKSVSKINGLENYILRRIPDVLSEQLKTLESTYQIANSEMYLFMGCLNTHCEESFSNKTSLINELRNISYGSWIQKNDTNVKSSLLYYKLEANFSVPEVTAIYENIIDPVKLGVTERHFVDESLSSDCRRYVDEVICDRKTSSKPVTYLSPVSFFTSCGVLALLRAEDYIHNIGCLSKASSIFLGHICRNVVGPCFNETLHHNSVFLSVKQFVLQYMSRHVFNQDSAGELKLVMTNAQRNLALGDGISECGILKHFSSNSTVDCTETYTMTTCLEDRDTNNNMVVKEYRDNLLINTCSNSVNSICNGQAGQTEYLYPVLTPTACAAPTPPSNYFRVWVSSPYQGVEFVAPEETTFLDTTVYRMKLNQSALNTNSVGMRCLKWNLSNVAPYWISIPHFQGCSASPHHIYSIPAGTDYTSFVEVEPLTGRLWRKTFKLQLNTVLHHNHVNIPGVLPNNVSFINTALPLHWMEMTSQVTTNFRDYHYQKVTKLTDASCGGLVGMSVLSVIVVIVSVIVILRPNSRRRIAPMPAVDSASECQNNI